ncbi:MAG: hypothetical protein AB1762_17360, partial [Gemmatimonadota bacterium]
RALVRRGRFGAAMHDCLTPLFMLGDADYMCQQTERCAALGTPAHRAQASIGQEEPYRNCGES